MATTTNFGIDRDFNGATISASVASQLPRRALSREPIRPKGSLLFNTENDTSYISDGLQWVALATSSGGLTLSRFRSDHGNNIFDNWDDLYAKLQTVARPITVYVEGTFPESVTTTSGTFDLLGVRFEGAIYPDSTNNIANKAVLRVGPTTVLVCASYFNNMILLFQSTTPSITLPYAPTPLGTQISIINSTFSNDSSVFGSLPTVSPILISGSTAIALNNSDITNFIATTPPVIETAAASSLFIDAVGTCNFQSLGGGVWSLGGIGTFNISSGPDTTISPFPQDPGVTITEFPRSSYRPTTPADWSGSTIISVADALDRIASVIGPIP